MSQPKYRVTCLIDGLTLLPVVLDPESAPWFCMACRHSWWAAELSEEARQQFRPSVQDFGYGNQLVGLRERVQAEINAAYVRGTSCREDMIELVPLVGIQRLAASPRVGADFKVIVARELKRKGG